jgi:hypothetical protein
MFSLNLQQGSPQQMSLTIKLSRAVRSQAAMNTAQHPNM